MVAWTSCAALLRSPRRWLILDEALAGFLPDGEDGLIDHPRVIHVRSFSKAHAMAGFRVGYAIVPRRRTP